MSREELGVRWGTHYAVEGCAGGNISGGINPAPQTVKNLPLRGRCPEGAEGENLAIARNISGNRTVLSPTACGRSPLAEGAKG